MTEVEKMEAGRELDALVAERVMGYRVESGRMVPRIGGGKGFFEAPPSIHWTETGRRIVEWQAELPRYSTDTKAAWEVVEKMRESFRLRFSIWQEWSGSWYAVFGTTFEPNHDKQRHANTAPHAICLAALAALSRPEDGG